MFTKLRNIKLNVKKKSGLSAGLNQNKMRRSIYTILPRRHCRNTLR